MGKSIITKEEIKNAINKITTFNNREEIQVLLKKRIGNGHLYIQRLIDGLGFIRFDIMRANENWDGSEEPEGILVFLDEGEKFFELDKDYQNKWDEYKNWMFKNTGLNMDHRLVSKDSILRGHQLFDIAYDFFTLYNIIQGKKFKNININRVGQIQTIQRLLKLGFQFINKSEKLLFQSIIKNPENRDTINYKTTYGDIIKNMIIKKGNAQTKENLIIFQMIYNL